MNVLHCFFLRGWTVRQKRMCCTLRLPFVDLIQGSTDAGIGSIHHVAQHFPHGKAWQDTDSPLQAPRVRLTNRIGKRMKLRIFPKDLYGLMIQFYLNRWIESTWISKINKFFSNSKHLYRHIYVLYCQWTPWSWRIFIPEKRWKTRILHQKCISITDHSWATGLLARHYMFKTTQKFQLVKEQWPYHVSAMDVQFTIHGLWICELSPPVASAPGKPTWASWNRFRQQFGCKIHGCPSQKLRLLWDPWPKIVPWLTGTLKGTFFQKEYQSSEIEKTGRKKTNEKSTGVLWEQETPIISHLCVSSQLVSLSTLQGTNSSAAWNHPCHLPIWVPFW